MSDNFNATALRDAREARKLSLAEVSSFARIAESRLQKFETGVAFPSYRQITKLSDLYNIPFYAFYSKNDIEVEDVIPDFRKSNPTVADLSPKGLTRLWQVERRSRFIGEVSQELGKNSPNTGKITRITNDLVVKPTQLRAAFDEWLSARIKSFKFAGSKEDVFSKHLRLFLDVHGCQTIVNTAPIDDYLGFYVDYSPKIKTIFVNRDVRNEKRRLFTLSHELAHFAYNEEGISNPFIATNVIERQCNAFAAEFLAPDDLVRSIVSNHRGSIAADIGSLVDALATQTLLSRQASTIRLRELDLVSTRTANSFLAKLSKSRKIDEPRSVVDVKPVMGRNAVISKTLSEVGVYAAYTASIALKAGLIDTVDINRGLGISESIQSDVLKLAVKRYEVSAV